jgi:diguanylate cyclase (GGDEF)-like protein/PAS domain S-box-containing protein
MRGLAVSDGPYRHVHDVPVDLEAVRRKELSVKSTSRCKVFRFEHSHLAGSDMVLIAELSSRAIRKALSRQVGLSMPSTSRDRVKQPGPPLIPSVSAGRRLPLRILFVHRDVADVELCVQELRRANLRVTADVVLTPEQFAARVKAKYYDVVLAEYPSPNWQGPHELEGLSLRESQIPCIFLIDIMQPETVAELITNGAADCVSMDHLGHLPVAVRRALSDNHLREERDRTEKRLRHSEARYRALVGNLIYGICRCNIKGKFLDVNPALTTMLGYASREELLAVNLATDVLGDPSKRAQLLGRSTEFTGSAPLETEWKSKSGATINVRLSGREVKHERETDSYEIIVENVTQQRKLEDQLRQQAAKDALTGLANYRHLVEIVDSEIKRSQRTARQFALLFLDLDGLKQINDRHGHLVGSQALCRLADVLCICSRKVDTPARFGGDEFALVLPETGQASASLVAQRICDRFANDGREPKLSVSIGVAIYPQDGENVDSLLGAADAALYEMKTRTRGADATTQTKTAGLRHKERASGKTN